MPKPIVNHSRAGPSAQPTISLALLVQVGGMPGSPGAWPEASGRSLIAICCYLSSSLAAQASDAGRSAVILDRPIDLQARGRKLNGWRIAALLLRSAAQVERRAPLREQILTLRRTRLMALSGLRRCIAAGFLCRAF